MITAAWKQIPGGLTRISKGKSGVWGVNSGANIYQLNSNGKPFSKNCSNIVHSKSTAVKSIVVKSCITVVIYPIYNDNMIHMSGNSWTQIAGKLVQVASGSSVWGVNGGDNIYKYLGNNRWQQIPGKLTNVSFINV